MSRKQALIRGTAVLTVTSLSTRFMGFFYRMFLSHTFGEENVGLYQLVFPVYALGISLSCAGMELALSRCVAREAAAGRMQKTRELLKTSLIFTFFISCMISLFIRQNADTIALTFLRDSRCSSLLFLLSYTFPFASIHSCICGYSLGLKQTKIPAVSQLLEQAFRILSVIVICMYCSGQGQNISIAFAVAGLTFGEIAASFYSLHSIRQSWKQISEKSRSVFLPPAAFRRHLQRLLEHALPLTASRVFLNILQSVEAVSIPVCLQYYGMPAAQSLQTYGVLTGMALPCILFPSAVTNAVSSMLLHFAWMFLLWCSSDTRKMDWNFSVQKSACRKFYSDTRMDLSVSVYEHCTSQHDQRTGKDYLFFSVQPFQPLHTDHRCLSFHPRRRNQRISERSADQPDIPVSLLHSPVICIRRQILTDFPHKKEPIHDIKHIFPCIGSFILHFCIFTVSSKTSL